MSDRTQIGPKVDEELWAEFREYVKSRHGQTRGVLGDELENAIRNYIHFGPDRTLEEQFAEFNERLQRVEGAVGTAESDGGTDARSGGDTHTRAERIDERPPPNAPTHKKVAYLAGAVRDRFDFDPDGAHSLPRDALRDVVRDEYGFRRDTARRYVAELIDRFGLEDHPAPGADLLVTEARFEELLAEQRADAADELDSYAHDN